MKKRILSLLLALCTACTLLVMPASAGSANSAVQAAVMLGGLTSGQPADAALTRGQLAKLLAAFSPIGRAPPRRARPALFSPT